VIRLLAVSGSLRAVSTNTTLLKAAMRLAPAGMVVELFEGLGELPHFNPDLDTDPLPAAVAAWRARVTASDGLLISSPEYARGIPGSLKNAFDWLVSDTEFAGKPVAFFHASERAVASQAALRLVLETMSARVVEEATITVPLLGRQTDVDSLLHDAAVTGRIAVALSAYAEALT
jgi:NAD(P)H-dependent FMN reductase